jgi:hypothetical protein
VSSSECGHPPVPPETTRRASGAGLGRKSFGRPIAAGDLRGAEKRDIEMYAEAVRPPDRVSPGGAITFTEDSIVNSR